MTNDNKNDNIGLEVEPMEFFDPKNPPSEDMEKWGMEFLHKKASPDKKVTPSIITPVTNNNSNSRTNTISVDLSSISKKRNYAPISAPTVAPTFHLKTNKLSAFDVAKKFCSRVPIRINGTTINVYNGLFYQKATELDMKRLIRKECEEDIIRAKSPYFIKQVLDFVILQPEIIFPDVPISTSISFFDGVLDLYTGKFYSHSHKFFTRYLIQGNYLSCGKLQCPCFTQFLNDITGNDEELKNRIWEMIGYLLTPDMGAKKLFLLQGCPNSGKSVLSDLLRSLFNPEAVSALDVHSLNERFSASMLEGKAICLSPDLPAGVLDNKSTSKLKQLTGNDVVSAAVKFSPSIEYRGTTKFVLATNHPLLTHEYDQAFVDRIVVIPFVHTIPVENRDTKLLKKLKYEHTAIIQNALNAYFNLKNRYYVFSGDYELNSASVLHRDNSSFDVKTCIYSFLKTSFVKDLDSGIFISEAHKVFIENYNYVPVNSFSQTFFHFASELFGATKKRERQFGENNPTSYIKGIRFVGGVI